MDTIDRKDNALLKKPFSLGDIGFWDTDESWGRETISSELIAELMDSVVELRGLEKSRLLGPGTDIARIKL